MMLVLRAIFNRLNLFETINYIREQTKIIITGDASYHLQFINNQLPGTQSNQTQTHHGHNHNRGIL